MISDVVKLQPVKIGHAKRLAHRTTGKFGQSGTRSFGGNFAAGLGQRVGQVFGADSAPSRNSRQRELRMVGSRPAG